MTVVLSFDLNCLYITLCVKICFAAYFVFCSDFMIDFCFSIVKNVNFNNSGAVSTYAAPILTVAVQKSQLLCQFYILRL